MRKRCDFHKTALWVPTQIEQLSIFNKIMIIFSHLDSLLLNVGQHVFTQYSIVVTQVVGDLILVTSV